MARTRLRTRLLTAVLSPLVVLGVLEAALRLAGYRYLPGAAEREVEAEKLPTSIYRRDSVLLWTLPPSTVVDEPDAGFPRTATNRMGLRGKDPPRYRRSGELRVLCLGDSVTFGLGVWDGETWPEQLERILASSPELAGRPVHVLNGGVPGWSCVQGMRLLDQLRWYEPDFIVFWFGMNDVLPAWGRPDSEKGGDPRLIDEAAFHLSGLRTVQLMASAADALRSSDGRTRASLEDYADAVERLKALEAGGGPQVIYVRTPEQNTTTAGQLEQVVARAEAEGVEWVAGPAELLLTLTPASHDTYLVGRVVEGPEGRELRYGANPGVRWRIERIRSDIEEMRGWERGLAARYALLPEGAALGEKELLRGADPAAVFIDNCHLNGLGCRLAAECIASRILARLRR